MIELGQILIFLFGFIWVVIASNQVAKFFQKIRLPLITGFLLSGILIGPYVLDLIPKDAIPKLNFINNFSLAFIALAAGSELYLKEIRNSIKSIVWNTFGQLVITFILISLSVYFLEGLIPFMSNMNNRSRIAVAILSGSIFIARSPSSAIAVINELRAKGRFTKTAISVTVILDVLVIVLFTICLSVAKTLINNTDFDVEFILLLFFELTLTMVVGFFLAKVIQFILSINLKDLYKSIFILLLGMGIFFITHLLSEYTYNNFDIEILIEPLLVCIIAGFWITNYSKYRLDFQKIIHETGPVIYAAFFTLAGATLSIDILISNWIIAVSLFVIYIIALIIGTFTGNTIAGNPSFYKKIGWMPYITQAGVGFALVYEVSIGFPDWGAQFASIIIAVIVLNQLIGPPLFKWAIKIAGESRLYAKSNIDSNKNALIFGLESQSLGLVKDLQKANYKVEMVSIEKRKNIQQINDVNIHFLEDMNMLCLNDINIKKFETIVLMLSDDENYKICKLINKHVGTKIVIVRLFDSIYSKRFYELGAIVVDPATAIVSLLEQFVLSPISASLLLGKEDNKAMVDFKVSDRNLHGIALRDLRLPTDVIVLSVKRKGQMLISHGYTRLRIGDIVTIVGSIDSLDDISLQFEE